MVLPAGLASLSPVAPTWEVSHYRRGRFPVGTVMIRSSGISGIPDDSGIRYTGFPVYRILWEIRYTGSGIRYQYRRSEGLAHVGLEPQGSSHPVRVLRDVPTGRPKTTSETRA